MPHSKEHDEKKVKNYIVMGVIVFIAIVFFAITIIKVKNAADIRNQPKQTPANNMVQATPTSKSE